MTDLFDLPFEEEPEPAPEPPSASPVGDGLQAVPLRAQGVPVPAGSRQPTVQASARRVFSVTELTVRVRDLLEAEFSEVWVEGELSGCRLWNTGHLYFTLKDGASQIKAVIFRSALRYLRFKPVDG